MYGGRERVISRDVDFILQGHLALFDCAKPHPCQEARQREAPDDSSRSRRTGSQYNRGWPSKCLNWLLHVVQTSLNHFESNNPACQLQPAGKRMAYFERESILISKSNNFVIFVASYGGQTWWLDVTRLTWNARRDRDHSGREDTAGPPYLGDIDEGHVAQGKMKNVWRCRNLQALDLSISFNIYVNESTISKF